MGALPLPPHSALWSAAALGLARPLPPITSAGAQGTSGVGVPASAPPLRVPVGRTTTPGRPCAVHSADTARGRSEGAGCDANVAAALPASRPLPRARPSGSCSWAEGLGRREAVSPTARELPGWKRGVPPPDRHRDFPARSGRRPGASGRRRPGCSRPAAPALSSREWPGDLGPAPRLSAGDATGPTAALLAGLRGFRRAPGGTEAAACKAASGQSPWPSPHPAPPWSARWGPGRARPPLWPRIHPPPRPRARPDPRPGPSLQGRLSHPPSQAPGTSALRPRQEGLTDPTTETHKPCVPSLVP